MRVHGAGGGQGGGGPDLRVSGQGLTKLADDLDDMQDYLNQQVKRMDSIVDRIEAGWGARRRRRIASSTGRRPRTPYASAKS
ncbi:hypothetical protein [Streptomyces mirabilis]|uniref:hypothetical protein n=1 Tax=Streptomyces mirabilis TaxID=68239 RepID=UPI0036EA20C1